MALKKELEILLSDELGGEQWLKVIAIDFEQEVAEIVNLYGEDITIELTSDLVHDIRVVE